MKNRPTIALAMIVRNEAHNLGPLLQSVEGCFDQIHITDTGSADNTVELLQSEKLQEIAKCPIFVHHFKWVHDFAKARQYSFDQVPGSMDYVMWMDGDDVLSGREEFLLWRDKVMHSAHRWLVDYKYAFDDKGNCVCEFFRERVVKNKHGFSWKYFVHEGLVHDEKRKCDTQQIKSFTINHQRTAIDEKADRSRNIEIFEMRNIEDLEPRMLYYYGKELFDAGQHLKALNILQDVASLPSDSGLEAHDRIMTIQYLSMCYGRCGKWEQSLNVALNGMQLAPARSEMWICAADAFLRLGNVQAARLYYEGAKHGERSSMGGAIYTSPHAQNIYPSHQLAQIYLRQFDWKSAEKEVARLRAFGQNTSQLDAQILELKNADQVPKESDLIETEDIVISTPPGCITDSWDEHKLEKEGMGGSETACVEVARLLKEETGKNVKVFQKRRTADVMPSGVEYFPLEHVEAYFRKYKPLRHIAWRHANNLTPAKTYVWCHDLLTSGAEKIDNYEKHWCLTEFHSSFVRCMQGVPSGKIDLVRNGIDPELFTENVDKNPMKVIFSSSPDRGWERSIEICKRAREELPELELHLFYGTKNMRKGGLEEYADYLDEMVRKHDWVKYHGFVDKKTLVNHFKESAVWLYPADFIETSCITAMESLCAGTYPLVRNMGALKYTLKDAHEKGMCTILDSDACDAETYDLWAVELTKLLKEKAYERVIVDPQEYSWKARIKDYIKSMEL